jgi:hypothetical protein
MKTQAWAWLVAGVAALGLNGFYQDGGFAGAHQVAERVESRSAAVLALATGRTDRVFADGKLVEAKMVMLPEGPTPCALARAMARERVRMAQVQVKVADWQAEADRQEAEFERQEAAREQTDTRMAADVARIHTPAVTINPVSFKTLQIEACPRVHVSLPRIARVDVSAVSIPAISIPRIEIPQVNIPRIEIPRIDIPRIEIPRVDIPRIQIPKISIPAVPMVSFETGDSGPV